MIEKLAALGAPIEMREWAADMGFAQIWQECPRGDWLIAVLAAAPLDGKLLTHAAIDCAEPCLIYVRGPTYALRNAIACAKNWIMGMAGLPLVKLAVQQAGEEENAVVNTVAEMRDPALRQLSGMARYALRSAAHSAVARPDAQNAVAAAAECGIDKLATLAASADRIRARIAYDAARQALGV